MVARASYLCCELNWTQQAKIFYNFFYFFVSFGYVVHARCEVSFFSFTFYLQVHVASW